MNELFPALHKAILGVDIEGFADRRRTNPDQLAMRDGLYRCLRTAFGRSGIAWEVCYHEDRGDGALILVPPEVPKILLVTSFPQELSAALRSHNQAHSAESRIRVRLVVHAGEVHRDGYGVSGTAVNVAFRLLEATALKQALLVSPGLVALIASRWFFEEVIWHAPASHPAAYRQVRVLVKETDELAWIGLPDTPHGFDEGQITTGVAPSADMPQQVPASGSPAPPQVPGLVRRVWRNVPVRNPGFTGRDGLLAAVREALLAGDQAVVQALHGIGGVGKTQLAAEYAHRFRDSYDLVWWITAEQAGLIGEQFAALADELGCAPPGATVEVIRRAVLSELRERNQWLLVFDNAEEPGDLAGWLPGGAGHVLITSRARHWAEIAVPIEVDVLARAESAAILRDRVPTLSAADADSLAGALGDLPLAVAQAAGYMADTGMPAGEYANLLAARATEILDQGRPLSYPRSLSAVTELAYDRLRDEDPAAAELAGICAFLAPELIPSDWFTRAAEQLPAAFTEKAADPVAWRRVLARLGRNALARIDQRGLQMHRLTQAILRGHISSELTAITWAHAEAVLAANHPGHSEVPANWPRWAQLLPHLLALDPAATSNPDLRNLAYHGAWYMLHRGDFRNGHDIATDIYHAWRDRLGPDDHYTLMAANALAEALRLLGDPQAARELDEDTLARRRRVFGDDDSWTLGSASNLAIDLRDLGDLQAARELDEDTLARRRRVLGDDHPGTLISANNLAADLRDLGDPQAARDLDEDTLARRRRVLSENHPRTLMSASNLAADLRDLGDLQAARELDEDTLARRRRVLGEDHPDTLTSASNLAADLCALSLNPPRK